MKVIESAGDNSVILVSDSSAETVGFSIQTGPPGMSAYQMALNNGFVGTEQEWLRSLTAYGIALDNGFVGTEQEWLDSLGTSSAPIEVVPADSGKVLSNDGSVAEWDDINTIINANQITWDLGQIA